MAKYRIYEIAKELNTDSKKVMNFLSEHKITVKSQLSSVEEDVHSLIINNLKDHAAKTAAPKPAEKSAAPVKPAAVRPAQNPRPAAPAAEVKRDASTVDRGNRQDHHNNNRPAGSQNRSDGNRGGFRNNDRNNDRSHSDRTGAPRQHTAGGNRDNRPGQNNGSRPSNGSRFNDRQGSNGHTGGNNRGFQKNDREGGYNKNGNNQHRKPGNGPKDHAAKPAAPVGMNSAHAGKEMGKRNSNFHQHEKKDKIKGSYATRENRPTRSADHMMHNHKHKNNNNNNAPKKAAEVVRPTSIEVGESISVKEFAAQLGREASEIIKKLFMLGKMVTINQEIDHETAELVALDYNCEVKEPPPEADPTEVPEVEDDPALRVPRPPVVTVMGHVDHGKTSLLDAIRKTNVTAREAGGITQHIGAYRVICQGRPIVFLDTPGHEAFTAMRARGAQVTDIAVLVVAADDGVMPQTLEAINHAKAAKVPIIVAINKIDKEGANPEFVMQQLSEHGLIPEAWGGDTIMVPVSARQKTGISDILEMILLVADMLELKANPKLPAHGTVIEAKLDKGRGPVATVLIDRGTLHIGDCILAGTTYGKVRAMVNDRGEKVKKALPSTPVEVLGLNDVPAAGDIMDATDEHTARSVAEKRLAKMKMEEQKQAKVSLDDIFNRIQEGELKELNIVVKADVQGTIQALEHALGNIKNSEVKVVVVHSGVGAINESDVMLASAANALIIGFNVRPDANARKAADTEKVDIRTYRVIYDAVNDVEAAIKGMLAPKFKEKIIGHVEIRQVIPINKVLIAGAYVKDGKITRSSKVRLVRDGIVIHEGELDSLRRFKDDVKEVAANFECGLTLADYRDIKVGDQLEVYVMEEVAPE
ncbi:translation initiation factor IF-2 [Acidaminococcus sp. NSJ-142]|jgi:translation initiation factor IF-2|uniref:translation initiation factor IF-2 n=1 Tax=Acidaminococcus TaxID=904 RepID=UPI000CF8D0D6|nr:MULTISPECIES: translation initiation factor IF-2 [Acidaminococcus]MCD2435494.1 translation initiation factor IF-2 [Acidaminococcus hominis]MCH4095234.1 translation initiation factor IF-2 [Acidaminococcus provencensis]RHK03461.1 translation initiation factor IF-2 [Acidaminococcus sp. AM05-11]